ncbi:xylulokinase [Candidatus Enterococcus murrayae]|uniref:Xylulose kinase n=1 Tax=Candidatus Enterococcus murrayae TaxID=2815321 RepID=A0ABS3HLA7_9ENTE|nr:xylulokinase [Enterococcus sp. MJM16]MBO0454228.1 xylulokinase [Enterococcus sp. MJM16]
MKTYLGIDLGTSSLKIIAGDAEGNVIGKASSSFEILSEKKGYSEERPQDWIKAFDLALRELLVNQPNLIESTVSLAFAGQMHSLVLLDKAGKPLRNAILWNDTRTTDEVILLNEKFGEHLLSKEKNIALEGFTLPKILWIKKYQADIWKNTWKFMLPKDYLVYYLTGKVYTDVSDAAGTILSNIEEECWDEELLSELSLEREKCPEILHSNESAGKMLKKLKEKFGFKNDIDIVMGGADNACSALGNLSGLEQGLISVGTSGVVLKYSNEASDQVGKYHYFNSALNGQKYKMGVTLSAGFSLNWFKKAIAPTVSFSDFIKRAERSPVGSKGLIFLPYLFGERSPYFNAKMTAEFKNLQASHDENDMIRSIMEGVAFSLKNVYQNMDVDDEKSKTFRITGGIVKNPFWIQMFSDIFETEIEALEMDEGPAFGALICAINFSEGKSQEEIWRNFNSVKKVYKPIEKNSNDYKKRYRLFLEYSNSNNRRNSEIE